MATTGEWQVVLRRRRFPANWTTGKAMEMTTVKAYVPYKPTFAQIVATPRPGEAKVSGNSNSLAKPSQTAQRPLTPPPPHSPPATQYFYSPHSPTKLRFPPQSSFPEWKGRCFRCCRSGHTQAQCRNPRKCGKCWSDGHIASKWRVTVLNPAAKPFTPTIHTYKPTNTELAFDELLKGGSPPPKPAFPEERVEKMTVFIERDDTFTEVNRLSRAVVMYCGNNIFGFDVQMTAIMAVNTKLVREEEIRVSKLSRGRFLIHLPIGLAVETFVKAIPTEMWVHGYSFQQWSLLDDATVRMPRFKVLLDLVGLPMHLWREHAVIMAISKIGLLLGNVDQEHATDCSAWRVAIATDDLLQVPKVLTVVIGGLEYPIDVEPVTWERGPIYSASDFPILPQRFSKPITQVAPTPVTDESGQTSSSSDDGDDGDGGEMIHCSRRVIMELCQGLHQSNIPEEIRSVLMATGRRSGPAVSIEALKDLVFRSEEQGHTHHEAGHTAAELVGQNIAQRQDTTRPHMQPGHSQSENERSTAPLTQDELPRLSKTALTVQTRGKSILEPVVCSVQGTVLTGVHKKKGGRACANQLSGRVKKDEAGFFKGVNPIHQDKRAIRPQSILAARNFTSSHGRFKGLMGHGRGRNIMGPLNRQGVGRPLVTRATSSKGAINNQAQRIHNTNHMHIRPNLDGPGEYSTATTRAKYTWTRDVQTVQVRQMGAPNGKDLTGPITVQAQGGILSEKPKLKRKPMINNNLNEEIETGGPAKKPSQTKFHDAKIDLRPDGFFRINVDREHCKLIGDGCGVHTEDVVQELVNDNNERKKAIIVADLLDQNNKPQEEEQVNLDPASEDDAFSDEDVC